MIAKKLAWIADSVYTVQYIEVLDCEITDPGSQYQDRNRMPPSRREELVEAAMKIFSKGGFHGTGIEQVLQESGICRMTLYNHFKSKDELILAALRRRDEIFRNRLMKFVASRGGTGVDAILAVFDFYSQWFGEADFCGCMFINASAEFRDSDSPISRAIVEHRAALVQYIKNHCEQAELNDPSLLAEQLGLLLDGAIVTAQGSCCESGSRRQVIQRARQAAIALINASAHATSKN